MPAAAQVCNEGSKQHVECALRPQYRLVWAHCDVKLAVEPTVHQQLGCRLHEWCTTICCHPAQASAQSLLRKQRETWYGRMQRHPLRPHSCR
jgi:hypothetical protein